ncbi:MAG: hypothetical protein IH991_07845 [Planctomycetes bacterium]|nr:hypothetical protein [Planctomycetota bacterium]
MTTSRWINLAIVVALLICPLAWYVAAVNGPPVESNEPVEVRKRDKSN